MIQPWQVIRNSETARRVCFAMQESWRRTAITKTRLKRSLPMEDFARLAVRFGSRLSPRSAEHQSRLGLDPVHRRYAPLMDGRL